MARAAQEQVIQRRKLPARELLQHGKPAHTFLFCAEVFAHYGLVIGQAALAKELGHGGWVVAVRGE
jgi:hypothetical protein